MHYDSDFDHALKRTVRNMVRKPYGLNMNRLKQWFPWLFDFSQGDRENRENARILTGVLQVAIAESETDAGFEQVFRQCVKAATGLSEERMWAWLNRCLSQYRSAGEFAPMPRTLAIRFLRDIPRRYGQPTGLTVPPEV